MNARDIEKSEDLQRVGRLLLSGRRLSTWEVAQGARVCAVNSIMSELRDAKNGWRIHCKRDGRYWYYSLLSAGRGVDLIRRAA